MDAVETVTVLFTDLVGSTGLASRVGPGAAEELRREHFGLLRGPVEETEGREVKNVGDGLMVVFRSSSRAVRCAVSMQQSLDQRNRRADEQLMIRIGVSAGEADVEEGDYFGPPVVEAARLCNAAAGGQILCGDLVRMMAREGHSFRSMGTLELKGLPEPFPTHEIEWAPVSGSAGALPLPQRLREVPPLGYVGRREEREALAFLLEQAREGSRRVAFLSGEPGIGKTRLATHLAVEAHGDGTTVLYGRCDEDLGSPYRPWVEALHHYVREAPEAVLSAHAERHGGELARLVPEVRDRLPDYPAPTESDPEAERYLLLAAVSGLLEEATRERPLVLILDDLHWADKPSLSLLRHLVTRGDELRLLVLGTYRDSDLTRGHPLTELLADLHREEGVSRVPLSGLDEDNVISIMAAAAGHDIQADGVHLAHAILRETDGNPFFVGELLRHLRESGAIVQGDDGRFRVEGRIEDLGLPQSVREVVGRRVERLGDEARRALSVAAVVGRDFEVALLARVMEVGEDELLDLLDEALEASVVHESSGAVGRFTFAHALINHTLYEELSRTRRARLHGRIAAAIEAECGDDPGGRVAELAHHSIRAAIPDDAVKAIEYARRAGERALAELAPDEALRWFEQAAELVDDEAVVGAGARCDLLVGLGEAQRQVGDPAHRETLLQASAMAVELGDADRAARAALANTRGFTRAFGQVDIEVVSALRGAAELNGPIDRARTARLMARQAAELQYDPDHEGRWALVDEALVLAREAGDTRTLAHVLLDHIYASLGRESLVDIRQPADELLERAADMGDPSLSIWADVLACGTAVTEGNVDRATAELAHARATADELGQPAMWWFVRYIEAALHLVRGELAAAEPAADEAAQIGSDSGQADALLIYGLQHISIRVQQDRADEIVDLLEASVEANPGIPALSSALAVNHALMGRLGEAEALVSEAATTHLAGVRYDQGRTTALANYADAAFLSDAGHAAEILYESLEPWADQVVFNGATCPGSVQMHLGMLASLLGKHQLADEHFERACGVHDRGGMRLCGAYGRVSWAEALARRGDNTRAHDQAGQALAVAQEHGYALIERRATRILEPLPTN